jgi:hypothetical protein
MAKRPGFRPRRKSDEQRKREAAEDVARGMRRLLSGEPTPQPAPSPDPEVAVDNWHAFHDRWREQGERRARALREAAHLVNDVWGGPVTIRCEWCKQEMQARRNTRRTCSDRCRAALHRYGVKQRRGRAS